MIINDKDLKEKYDSVEMILKKNLKMIAIGHAICAIICIILIIIFIISRKLSTMFYYIDNVQINFKNWLLLIIYILGVTMITIIVHELCHWIVEWVACEGKWNKRAAIHNILCIEFIKFKKPIFCFKYGIKFKFPNTVCFEHIKIDAYRIALISPIIVVIVSFILNMVTSNFIFVILALCGTFGMAGDFATLWYFRNIEGRDTIVKDDENEKGGIVYIPKVSSRMNNQKLKS